MTTPHRSAVEANAHHIVIVGGGAGGLELATRLGDRFRKRTDVRVTLIDRGSTHIWKPLLHEVAAGSMDPYTHQLAYAAQASWHGFDFQQGELSGLDRAAHLVHLSALIDADGVEILPARSLPYHTLVIAVGSVTNFFGVPGAEQYALPLDTPEQAERFRRRLISACMRAEHKVDETAHAQVDSGTQEVRVSVAIIGAGATGVELSAELRNTAQVLSAYGLHRMDPRHDIRINLIEAGERVLPALPNRVSDGIVELLAKLDIDVLIPERVTEVGEHSVTTASGRRIPSDLTVWAAGIKAPAITASLDGLPLNRSGQIDVSLSLQTPIDPDIFAFGDCANCAWKGVGGSVPPRAQVAHQQAEFLVKALTRRLEGRPLGEFQFRDLGSLVSLGRLSAVGNLMGGLIGGNVLIEGLLARYMYASLYRMHVQALHGFWGMLLDTAGHWLRSKTTPRVKLH